MPLTTTLTIRYLSLTMPPELRETLSAQVGHPLKAGDAILISFPTGETLLIDSGMPHSGAMLYARLQELGVAKLDYVLTTHPHWDHIGGFLTILPQIPVGVFYQSPVVHGESEHYQELQELLQTQQIKVVELIEGDRLQFGLVRFQVLNPAQNQIPSSKTLLSTAEINNLSLVLRLDYARFSMLFTGDLYCEQEELLVEKYGAERLHVDVLDVPHHGRATSSSHKFITTVNPQVAIISHEDQGQPREERYKELAIPVVALADHGEILITTNGETTTISAGELTISLD